MCYEVTESTLIERSQLLDAIADDDDIEWKTDPFEMRPESANPETPDEIIAMITFAGSPELQEQLRCDTAVRTEYVLPVTSPVSLLTQTSFTTHSVQYIQYTLSVHLTLL